MSLFHVAYGGRLLGEGIIGEVDPVAASAEQALEWYGWFRVVDAQDELEAIETAADERNSELNGGEVYYVTKFVQEEPQRIEVVI